MRWTPVIASCALVLTAPASALADGGPVSPVQGGSGIAVPGSSYRYVALAAGRGRTLVRRLGAGGASLRVAGAYGVPGVDYSGSTTGLSADGGTLVLAELPGGTAPRTTRLIVLDAPRLAIRARLVLPGWSIVDAISPNGRWLYLIHYASSDFSRYEVLAYDLVTRHLLAKPIVDPHGGDYTLYVRPSGRRSSTRSTRSASTRCASTCRLRSRTPTSATPISRSVAVARGSASSSTA